MPRTLSATEAAARLGVSTATLYAYVSRGLVRSEPGDGATRNRRYLTEDIDALARRKESRRDPARTVREALHWGTPVLESSLTLIEHGRLYYRGRDAVELSRTATLEAVAELLWTDGTLTDARLFDRAPDVAAGGSTPTESFALALTHGATHDLGALAATPDTLPAVAARVVALLVTTVERQAGLPAMSDRPVHERLARAWVPHHPDAPDLLRRALVLLADHELNVSSFTARCVASSGANLYHAALGGLCALQGPRHGLATELAHDLLAHARRDGVRPALTAALRRSGTAPGFGHPLYPDGDPRGAELLRVLAGRLPADPTVRTAHDLVTVTREATGLAPNVDLGLAAVAHALDLDAGRALGVFALGRSVGWLAHAIETAREGHLVRPRATYVGPRPTPETGA